MDVKTDCPLIDTSAPTTRFVLVTVTAPAAPRTAVRPPANVSLVLDRSGSMDGEKLVLGRRAVRDALDLLTPADRFSLVAYDDRVDVVSESTRAFPEAVRGALARLDRIDARGSTDLSTGWLRGCEQVARHLDGGSAGRCFLLTDGLANRGVTHHGELVRHARELATRGVITSTFGVGRDFDERLLRAMAAAGGGRFYYIETPRQIPELVSSELRESLEIVARDAALLVEVPDGVHLEPLHRFGTGRAGEAIRIQLGQLTSGEQLQVVLKVVFSPGPRGAQVVLRFALTDATSALGDAACELVWTYADPREVAGQPRHPAVSREVAALQVEVAREAAVELNRAGRFSEAQAKLVEVADWIASYGASDSVIQGLASSAKAEGIEFASRLGAGELKKHHFAASSALLGRDAKGKARRAEREEHHLEMHDGHPILVRGAQRLLIDTGSPVSFGDRPVVLLGDEHPLAPRLGPVDMLMLTGYLRTRVDALLGTDVLSQYHWLLDAAGRRAVLSRGAIAAQGTVLPAGLRQGVPCVELGVGESTVLAFLDTAARFSYMDRAAEGSEPFDTGRDFFPVLGTFETPLYRVPVALGEHRFEGVFGVLPDALRAALDLSGVHWILGSQILERWPVAFDFSKGCVTLIS